MESNPPAAPPTRHRYSVQLSFDDAHWLEEAAADEGIEPRALLQAIVTRLRQGRPALYRQALAVKAMENFVSAQLEPQRSGNRAPDAGAQLRVLAGRRSRDISGDELANDLTADVTNEPDAPTTADLEPDPVATLDSIADNLVANGTPAIPLIPAARERYNPGRR